MSNRGRSIGGQSMTPYHPADAKTEATKYLRLIAGRMLRDDANDNEMREAIEGWLTAVGAPPTYAIDAEIARRIDGLLDGHIVGACYGATSVLADDVRAEMAAEWRTTLKRLLTPEAPRQETTE